MQEKNGNKALELRTLTSNPEVMKVIIKAAFENKPIAVYPTFRDKLRAAATLAEKEFIKLNKRKNNNDLEFKFII